MSASSVITMGYGPPGSASLVLTLGYGQGAAAPIPPTPTPPVTVISGGGVKRRRSRVRRSDFSSQAAYELALKAALSEARFAIKEFDDVELRPAKPKSAKAKPASVPVDKSLSIEGETKQAEAAAVAIKEAEDRDEIDLLRFIIKMIEDDLDRLRS